MDIADRKAIVLSSTSGIGLETSLMLVERGKRGCKETGKAGDVPSGIRLESSTHATQRRLGFLMPKEILIFWSIRPAVPCLWPFHGNGHERLSRLIR